MCAGLVAVFFIDLLGSVDLFGYIFGGSLVSVCLSKLVKI